MSSAVIPVLRYENAVAAIDFLCLAFGFEQRAVYPDPRDRSIIIHAQLACNGGMNMLSSVQETEFVRQAPLTTVAEGRGNTQTIYVVVADPEAHCAQARSAGADIFLSLEEQPAGGRGYTARDPEGHVWTFGAYDPWLKADRQ